MMFYKNTNLCGQLLLSDIARELDSEHVPFMGLKYYIE